jgi:hypothetical protein
MSTTLFKQKKAKTKDPIWPTENNFGLNKLIKHPEIKKTEYKK